MKIEIEFAGGNDYWRAKVTRSAAVASSIMSDPSFDAWVRNHPQFDFTNLTPAQVADVIATAGVVRVQVGFNWNPFTHEIAEESDGAVTFNRAKERYGAGSPGNMAHEFMHRLGFGHNGNSPVGNQNTAPWAIGNEVEKRADAI